MKEYDIFVPLRYNEGTPIEADKLQDLQDELLARFGGLTYFPQPNQGFWRMSGITYRDEIVVYRVLATEVDLARQFLSSLKERLKTQLRQEEVLIVERDVTTL